MIEEQTSVDVCRSMHRRHSISRALGMLPRRQYVASRGASASQQLTLVLPTLPTLPMLPMLSMPPMLLVLARHVSQTIPSLHHWHEKWGEATATDRVPSCR